MYRTISDIQQSTQYAELYRKKIILFQNFTLTKGNWRKHFNYKNRQKLRKQCNNYLPRSQGLQMWSQDLFVCATLWHQGGFAVYCWSFSQCNLPYVNASSLHLSWAFDKSLRCPSSSTSIYSQAFSCLEPRSSEQCKHHSRLLAKTRNCS